MVQGGRGGVVNGRWGWIALLSMLVLYVACDDMEPEDECQVAADCVDPVGAICEDRGAGNLCYLRFECEPPMEGGDFGPIDAACAEALDVEVGRAVCSLGFVDGNPDDEIAFCVSLRYVEHAARRDCFPVEPQDTLLERYHEGQQRTRAYYREHGQMPPVDCDYQAADDAGAPLHIEQRGLRVHERQPSEPESVASPNVWPSTQSHMPTALAPISHPH